MRYYVGLNGVTRAIFGAAEAPTEGTHGQTYTAVIGPFRTKRGAAFMRDHGRNNPHCRTVAEAERLAVKLQADEGINESAVLESLVDLLDGKEWDADTLEAIAAILRTAGYEIREPQ